MSNNPIRKANRPGSSGRLVSAYRNWKIVIIASLIAAGGAQPYGDVEIAPRREVISDEGGTDGKEDALSDEEVLDNIKKGKGILGEIFSYFAIDDEEPVEEKENALDEKLAKFEATNGAKLDELQTMLVELRTKHDKLQTDHNQLQTDHDEIQIKHDQLQTDHDQIQTKLSNVEAENKVLNKFFLEVLGDIIESETQGVLEK